jgi:hypothetical protein
MSLGGVSEGLSVDYQTLANAAFGAVTFLGGWILNSLTTNVRQLARDLRVLEEKHQETRESFVTKVDHKTDIDSMTHRFDRIDDKLDALARELITRGT